MKPTRLKRLFVVPKFYTTQMLLTFLCIIREIISLKNGGKKWKTSYLELWLSLLWVPESLRAFMKLAAAQKQTQNTKKMIQRKERINI